MFRITSELDSGCTNGGGQILPNRKYEQSHDDIYNATEQAYKSVRYDTWLVVGHVLTTAQIDRLR